MTLEEWPTAIDRLSKTSAYDYLKNRSMPEFVEPLLLDIVKSFSSSSESQRRQMLTMMSLRASDVFGWYARKLAGQAVRNQSVNDLSNGLVALAIAAPNGDMRDLFSPLALLYRSAVELKQDPAILFDAVSRLTTEPGRKLFKSFLNRPENLKSIDVFGFSKGTGPLGFDYVPLLPEFGGPTPIS
jgi:hypothetical protein